MVNRKTKAAEVEPTRLQFATMVVNRLEEMNWPVMKLAKELETTYEHTRKLTKSAAFPSRLLLKQICSLLKLDFHEMDRLVIADKIQRKYGSIPAELAGKSPRFTEIERLLPNITDEQFEIIKGQLQGWDRVNRAAKRA